MNKNKKQKQKKIKILINDWLKVNFQIFDFDN